VTPEERTRWASSYSAMMQTDAWKDLEKYALNERELSVNKIDAKSAADLSLGEVCEERGIRKGIFKIMQHAAFRKEGI
jgi:hypothetical protein